MGSKFRTFNEKVEIRVLLRANDIVSVRGVEIVYIIGYSEL